MSKGQEAKREQNMLDELQVSIAKGEYKEKSKIWA